MSLVPAGIPDLRRLLPVARNALEFWMRTSDWKRQWR